jgi:Periplasmic binding protein-like domain
MRSVDPGRFASGRVPEKRLATVDVVRCTGHCGVDHQMDRHCGDILRSDNPPDRERGAQLLAAGVELSAEQRRRQRGVDEAGRHEVDPDRATRLRPALTVVSQPIYDLGRQAAELLLRRIGGEHFPARQVVLPTTLKTRGSSQRRPRRDPGP